MPRVIRSPGRGSLVQPADTNNATAATAAAAVAASSSVAHAAAGASSAADSAKENVGPVHRAAACGDFRHCFQLVPACALTYAAASDWLTVQPMSVASASIPIVAAALSLKTDLRRAEAELAYARLQEQMQASADSSLDPALLHEYDQLHGASPALSADGRSRADTLTSASVSEHTGTTGSKLRPNARTTSAAGLVVGTAPTHVDSKEGYTPERSASERSRTSDARSVAAAPAAAAAAASAAPVPAAKNPGKAPKDAFTFGSQSSQSQDSTPRSSQAQIVIPSTASAAVAPAAHSHGTVGPSYTLPSRRVASSDEMVLIPESQPAADAVAPTPTTPSFRISASTQPSTASALAASTVAPAIAISPSSTPGDSRQSHSTRSLGATAGLTFDASVVPPTLSALHTHVGSRQPAPLVDISFAHLDAIESDMRRMDVEVANMDARSRLPAQATVDAAPAHPISQESPPAEEEHHDVHMGPQPAPHSVPLHPLSSGTPPLAQSSLGRYESGYTQLRPPPSVNTSHSTIHTVSLMLDVQPVPPVIDPCQQQLYNDQSDSERSGHPSERSEADAAAESQPHPLPSAPAPPSHEHSQLFASTPPVRRPSASASDTPLHLRLSDTPQLAASSAVQAALPSSASFSSPSIGAASSRSSGAANHAPLPPVAEATTSLAAPPPSPPLSPRSPTLSEFGISMDEGRDAAAETPSQPIELASMSLELNFDDDEEGEAHTAAAAQPKQQSQPADAHMPAAVAEVAAAVAFPLVLNVSPLPPPTLAERPLSQAAASVVDAGLDRAVPLPLLTPPHPASIASPPNSAATTVVNKATPSSGRSAAAQPARPAVTPPLPALSAPADDVHSAPQHLSLSLVSPMKSLSSPAKPPSALQSPPKHMPVQRVVKQLRFGEHKVDAAAAAAPPQPQPRTELLSSAVAASLAPDLSSASCFAVTMDSFSPCTPPGRSSYDSSSHQPSMESSVGSSMAMGSNVGVVSPSPPEHAAGEVPAEKEEQKSGAPVASAAADAAGGSAAVVSVAWSRSRRAAEEDASMDVSEMEDRRGSLSSTGAAAATGSAEKRSRGKSFSKQPKSARPDDTVTVVRPMLNLITDKPVTISLLSESQPEESQAELSIDPVRRARAARAKKEAQAAVAAAKENTQQANAAVTPLESAPPARATTSPIKLPPASASSAHVPAVAPTPTAAAPSTVRPRTPVAATAAAATAIVPRSGGSSPAPSARRSVSPLQSPLALPPPPPRAVPHHYASARKIIVHTTAVRSPTAAAAAGVTTPTPTQTPRLGPSAAQARQMESPPHARLDREPSKVAAAPIVNEELPQRPKFPAAPLSVILEETSSMGSFSVPAASVGAAAAGAATSQRRSDSIVSRQSTSAPAAPALLPDAAAPMDVDLSQPVAPAALVSPRPEMIAVSPPPPPPPAASTSLPTAPQVVKAVAASTAASAPVSSVPHSALPQAVSSRKRRTPAGAASSNAGASESSPVDHLSQASTDSKRAKKTPSSAAAGEPSLARQSSRKAGRSPATAAVAPSSSPSSAAASSSSGPKHLRNSLLKGLVFLLTGLPKAKSGAAAAVATLESTTKLIVQHGGRCVESLDELPAPSDEALLSPQIVVLASEPKRTMKFMFSLARGLPPLQPAWLQACVAGASVTTPTESHLVALKSEEGRASEYPSSWLRSLRERAFLTPLPLAKRILFGLRVAVCGPASIVSDVSVVCREAGARVWSCSSEEESDQRWTAWHADSDEDSTTSLAATAASFSTRSSRRSGKDASSAAAAAAASSSASSTLPSVIDLVCTDSADSVSAWMQRSLAGATGASSARGQKRLSASTLPPVMSVKWLIQSLMLQKRLSDSERDEFKITL